MNFNVPVFPQQASDMARNVDAFYLFLVLITTFFSALIALLILYFIIRYRKTPEREAVQIHGSTLLEVIWTAIPLGLSMVIFVWAAILYFHIQTPPEDAMEIYGEAKQWMWKFQHPGGQREINALHVPTGRPIKVTLISQDVIHDFFVPAFRVKMDVLPGRYSYVWFTPTQPGTYHLFCSQYCGTNHSAMVGKVVVLDPAEYQAWLTYSADGSLAMQGRQAFLKYRCLSCHSANSSARAPLLEGLPGSQVPLRD